MLDTQNFQKISKLYDIETMRTAVSGSPLTKKGVSMTNLTERINYLYL